MTKVEHPLAGLHLRVPPQNLEAEQALLGALLANNKAFDRLPDGFRAEHFADPVHGRIFGALARRIGAGQLASATALKTDLENDGTLEEVGGTRYLAELVTATVGVANAAEYARVIHHCWIRRALIDLGARVVEAAFGDAGGQDAPAQIEAAEDALYHLAERGGTARTVVRFGAAADLAIAEAEAASRRKGGLAGVTTGYRALDRMTGGLMPGELAILGGRPSMGKTALGLAVAARAAAAGYRVLVVSQEMRAQKLAARAIGACAQIDTLALRFGRVRAAEGEAHDGDGFRPFNAAEGAALARARAEIDALPLVIDATPGATVAAVRTSARRAARVLGGLDLVVIDYLGLLVASEHDRTFGNRVQEVGGIARDAKALAVGLGVPVLLLAQLSRANEAREDKRPQLSDLRDSGEIEQHADVVGFIHREHYYLTRAAPKPRAGEAQEKFSDRERLWNEAVLREVGRAEVIVAKNREGPTGTTRLRYVDRFTWFWDESEWQGGGDPPHALGMQRAG